jgi:hypothetical protein
MPVINKGSSNKPQNSSKAGADRNQGVQRPGLFMASPA